MKLSLCIATFNEEKNIHYPLDSAYNLVDEVIIVDGGSTDKTLEIAKKYGKKIKIIKTDNPLMFHKNKQKAIEATQGEWILQLDADEALSEELKKEIKNVVNDKNQPFVGFWLPRKNWFLTKFLEKGGQYPDYTLRLYKKGYACFPCQDVHENVEIINPKTKKPDEKLKTDYLKNPLLHYADPDFSRYLHRWNRYTTMDAEKLKNQGIKNLSFFQYFIWKPLITFFSMYFRHKGFLDGFPGFIFALFSAIRFWVVYVKVKSLEN